MVEISRAESPLDVSLGPDELEAMRDHITSFIESQREAAGADIGIIALSGGIDSTLTGTLAVEALGSGNVYGLVLPSEVNTEKNMSDAERVAAELLDIEYDVIDVEPLVDAVIDAHPAVDAAEKGEEAVQTTVGNLRARIRAVVSYVSANQRNGFVLGTGNRSEAAVGYFTKYGDGAVDCHPIAPLYKQQVRQLAVHVGVPEDLAAKTATAELWTGQTDEEELGIGYDTLDSILALHVDGPLSATATAREIDVNQAVVDEVAAIADASAHKRRAPPGPGPLF